MAKLFSYYGLCPLIDQKSFLGLSEDKVPGCVIVTLGKKIVIRYKLSDQKQISSWSTRDMLTTSVVYDVRKEYYIAGFSNNQLRIWLEHENNLDKVKKHKFQKPIHTFVTQNDGKPVLVIFKDGTCSSVEYALENRKSERKSIFREHEQIKEQTILSAHGQTFVCYITESSDKTLSCVLVELDKENYIEIENSVKTRPILRTERHITVIGISIIPNDELSQVMTVWSDGRIFTMNLFNTSEIGIGPFISVLKSLSRNSPLTMLPLSPNYVAIYGADTNEEGASLIIYNIQFKIMQCRQQFKLFSRGAKLFSIGDNILLAAGQGVAVVPYQLATEQLASIVGSQKLVQIDDDIKIVTEMDVVQWGLGTEIKHIKLKNDLKIPAEVPSNVSRIIQESRAEGLPESLIVDLVFPILIESKNIEGLMWCLGYFKDVPESLVVALLDYALKLPDTVFGKIENINGTAQSCLQPLGRRKLINRILQIPINEAVILSRLRKNLAFTETILLLKYLCYLMSNIESCLSDFKKECEVDAMIVQWSSLLIDSHYQEFILSRETGIIELLVNFRQVINGEIDNVNKLKTTTVLLDRLKDGKSIEINKAYVESRYYSIEQVELC